MNDTVGRCNVTEERACTEKLQWRLCLRSLIVPQLQELVRDFRRWTVLAEQVQKPAQAGVKEAEATLRVPPELDGEIDFWVSVDGQRSEARTEGLPAVGLGASQAEIVGAEILRASRAEASPANGELVAQLVPQVRHLLGREGVHSQGLLRCFSDCLWRQGVLNLCEIDQPVPGLGHVAQAFEDNFCVAVASQDAVDETFEGEVKLVAKAAESPPPPGSPVTAQGVLGPGIMELQKVRHPISATNILCPSLADRRAPRLSGRTAGPVVAGCQAAVGLLVDRFR